MIFALLDHPYLVYFSIKNTLVGSIGDYRNEIDKNCYNWVHKNEALGGIDKCKVLKFNNKNPDQFKFKTNKSLISTLHNGNDSKEKKDDE